MFRTIKTMAEHTSATRKKLEVYLAQSKDYLAQRKECAQKQAEHAAKATATKRPSSAPPAGVPPSKRANARV